MMQADKQEPFYIHKGNVWAVPILHYNMEMAAQVRLAFDALKPDCVAVELPETMQLQFLHGASRLPDISVVVSGVRDGSSLYYMCEPCDASFEALRSALEMQIPAWCIDLDVERYPDFHDDLPDPYAVQRIGLKNYYGACKRFVKSSIDHERELYMAKRLKELSLSYDRILFVGGMAHIDSVLALVDCSSFPPFKHALRNHIQLCTLSESSCRDVMAECGWVSHQYEIARGESLRDGILPDRQKIIYGLFKKAAEKYIEETGNSFPGYHMRNLMKFVRNYALVRGRLMPDLFQLLSAAKGCVDHNYAYEAWALATEYPLRRNIDSLPELNLSVGDIWKHSKVIRFHLKGKNPKSILTQHRHKDRAEKRFKPPSPFSICSYPPEDVIIERFGDFLKKKGTQLLSDESSRTIPFTTSIEEGIDTRETIRHWHDKKLYVKAKGKPPGGVGSVVMIFDEDEIEEKGALSSKYSWNTTWIGEHNQESDMAFYATPLQDNVVGPGISRCEYGGFMMSYPPRRMYDVWNDPDYFECRSRSEVLLMAAIDYSIYPLITYVANKPPRTALKGYARRFGKKIVYLPIGQLSPVTLNKLRVFHVLGNQGLRDIAGEYIF